MRCARHPDVETNLKCSKCEEPICPRCLIQTPVGARCPACAQLRRSPMYQVPAIYYLRAAGAGLAVALLAGVIWSLIPLAGFFWLILAAAIGYAIGEVISLAVNRKRGPGLQVIGGLSVLVSYGVSNVTFLGGSVWLNISGLASIYGLIALAIGIIAAVARLR